MMNVYEALNDGISTEELTQVFNKEIAEAQERINQEKAAKEKAKQLKTELEEYLEDTREDLACCIADYINALVDHIKGEKTVSYDENLSLQPKDIYQMLEEFEHDLFVPKTITIGKKKVKAEKEKDMEIISDFLKAFI